MTVSLCPLTVLCLTFLVVRDDVPSATRQGAAAGAFLSDGPSSAAAASETSPHVWQLGSAIRALVKQEIVVRPTLRWADLWQVVFELLDR